jgi:hypothetical protein
MIRITVLTLALSATSALAAPPTERFTVIFGGRNVGHLNVDSSGNRPVSDFDHNNNGRGPAMKEALTVDAGGLSFSGTVDGTTTFGSKVSERFALANSTARGIDSTGTGATKISRPASTSRKMAAPGLPACMPAPC